MRLNIGSEASGATGLCVAAALVFFYLIPLTRVGEVARLSRSASDVTWTVAESSLRVPVETSALEGLSLNIHQSFFPQGGNYFRVKQAEEVVLDAALPLNFYQHRLSQPLIGDWCLDRRQNMPILSPELPLIPPFEIELELYGRSLESTSVVLDEADQRIVLSFRRGLINNDLTIEVNDRVVANKLLQISPVRPALSLFEPLLRGFLAAVMLVLCARLVLRIFPALCLGLKIPVSLFAFSRSSAFLSLALVGIFACAGFALAFWVAQDILEGIPHFQDDIGYLLRAKWISVGKLYELQPAFWQSLQVPHTYFHDDHWLSIYPIGWPLLLALGELIELPQIISPICGAISIVLLWLLGREVYSNSIGIMASLLLLLSPMSQILWGSMLSHAASAMFLILHVWLLCGALKRESAIRLFLAGLALGYAFSIRPLTAVAVGFPGVVFFIIDCLTRKSSKGAMVRRGAAGLSGGLLGIVPVLLDNYFTTGSPLLFAYTQGAGHSLSINNLTGSLLITDSGMALVLSMAFGWFSRIAPSWLALSFVYGFAFIPFVLALMSHRDFILDGQSAGPTGQISKNCEGAVSRSDTATFKIFRDIPESPAPWPSKTKFGETSGLGRARKYDYYLLAVFLSVPLAYLFHAAGGAHGFGPRFYYDVFFCLFVLTSRGFAELAEGTSGLLVRHNVPGRITVWKIGVGLVFIGLCFTSAVDAPGRLKRYQGYNFINGRAAAVIKQTGIEEGIVFVESWRGFAELARYFPTDLENSRFLVLLEGDDKTDRPNFLPQLEHFVIREDKLVRR